MKYNIEKKKHNKIFRKLKRNRKAILWTVTIQVIILAFGILMISGSMPVDPMDATETTITIENAQYYEYHIPRGSRSVEITANSETYWLTTAETNKLNVEDFYKTIEVGDEISITYIKKAHRLRKQNIIVAAHTDTEVYRTLEGYNSNKNPGIAIAFVSVIEVAFLTGCIVLWKKIL